MYEAHFGFQQKPFSLSPDTGLFVNLIDHEHCLSLLKHVLDSGEGFLKVIGDVGTGKTILCRKLLKYLEEEHSNHFHSVYIPNPMLSPIGIYRAVGQELGLNTAQQNNNDALLSYITKQVLLLAESNKSVVIVVDEAQSLPPATLEALRLITNLETEQKKLVQVILFGQTELDDLLAQHRFRQLRQRITFAHYLKPLTKTETAQYINYRLVQSGYNGTALFNNKSLMALYAASNGIPRMINVIAHKALMAAFGENEQTVTVKHIHQAQADNNDYKQSNTAIWFVLGALALFVAGFLWRFL